MERSEYIRLIQVILSMILFSFSIQADESRSLNIYRAYMEGDMNKWETVIREMENTPTLSDLEKKELIGYYYGYIGYLLGTDHIKTAKPYIQKGDLLITALLKQFPDDATLLAYKGSFLGFKMALNKMKAVTLGPESMRYIKKAYVSDPDNTQVIADMANMLYYAPAIFGGDKKEALLLYKKAIARIENNKQTENNWFYLNLLTTLAQLYQTQNQTDQAIDVYQKILRIEPDFTWVRDELYPEALIDK